MKIDTVEVCELAGVQLSWDRERGAAVGHYVTLRATDDARADRRGPYARKQARLEYDAMRAALFAAARQQKASLHHLVERRATRASR